MRVLLQIFGSCLFSLLKVAAEQDTSGQKQVFFYTAQQRCRGQQHRCSRRLRHIPYRSSSHFVLKGMRKLPPLTEACRTCRPMYYSRLVRTAVSCRTSLLDDDSAPSRRSRWCLRLLARCIITITSNTSVLFIMIEVLETLRFLSHFVHRSNFQAQITTNIDESSCWCFLMIVMMVMHWQPVFQ